MALDEPTDADTVFEEEGLTFSIDTKLYTMTGDITVDLTAFGFVIESANPVGGGGGGCGGCSSGSCS